MSVVSIVRSAMESATAGTALSVGNRTVFLPTEYFTATTTSEDTESVESPIRDVTDHTSNTTANILGSVTLPPGTTTPTTFPSILESTIATVHQHFQNLTTLPPNSITEDAMLSSIGKEDWNQTVWNGSTRNGSEIHGSEIEMMSTTTTILILFPLVLITLFIILGNLLVVIAVFSKRSLRTPQNIYIVSLAMTDMGVAVLVLPFNIASLVFQKWIFGLAVCKLHLLLDVSLCSVSIFHLCAIGIDRFRAITEGIHYVQKRNLRSVLSTIFILWIIALWIGSPLLLAVKDWEIRYTGDTCEMPPSAGFNFHLAVGALFFPLIIMSVIYAKIYYAIKERLRERARVTCMTELTSDGDTTEKLDNTTVSEDEESGKGQTLKGTGRRKPSAQISTFLINKQKFSLSKERKAARTLSFIMAAFIFCWLPLGFLNVIGSLCPDGMKPSLTLFHIFTWLGYVNSALNPVIYAVSNQEYQKAFRRILHLEN